MRRYQLTTRARLLALIAEAQRAIVLIAILGVLGICVASALAEARSAPDALFLLITRG
jgi:hypothetical protein